MLPPLDPLSISEKVVVSAMLQQSRFFEYETLKLPYVKDNSRAFTKIMIKN